MENQYSMAANAKSITINFPDPEIQRSTIHEFSDAIVNIHVISPLTPRFCVVTLKDDSNVEEVIERINQTPFGSGFLRARIKEAKEVSIMTSDHTIFITNASLFSRNHPRNQNVLIHALCILATWPQQSMRRLLRTST